MPGRIKIKTLGLKGVNVDKNPFELEPDELRQAQNAVSERLGSNASLKNRPGLDEFTTDSGMGPVLGGIGVLEPNGAPTGGTLVLYLGRGGST